ncbi:MAG TPA: cellulase family glycosylhydrolase [Treponemataceae bacterium]|jgi:aryl-phospho-beta-D-glucosidase BglC (GH1 family)|nr:cellulase family glycosylhydrolase [Treponemataceae bacterium]HZK19683.1 cellulase family glycosylhydrolase [Treponemataceae bacterium]
MLLERGINFGGWLSQCNHTEERYDSFIQKKDVERVKSWHFDHIRVPFDYNLIENEDASDKASGYVYLDKIISWCHELELNLILDLHKAAGYDFNDADNSQKNSLFNNEDLKKRFTALWEKIAQRYGSHTHVAFELLNEVVEQDFAPAWNELITRTVSVIRKYAPTTTIIYGGIQWNSARTVKLLEKPIDKNIIFTFHFYEPLIFTHQKAPWVPNMIMDRDIQYPQTMAYYIEHSKILGYKGKDVSDADKKNMIDTLIRDMVQDAKSAAKKFDVPLYCGEFGVIDRAPVQDSLNWFKEVFAVFKEQNIGSSIWSYKEMDFGIIDAHYDKIRDELIEAYIK